VLAPAGRLSLGYQDVPIALSSLPLTAEALREIPVPAAEGPVPLRALAHVIRGAEPIHYALDLDGEPSVALVVFKQPDASTVPVTRAVAETLERSRGELPAGVRWQRIYDQGYLVSLLREASTQGVQRSIDTPTVERFDRSSAGPRLPTCLFVSFVD
jgi:cobalt-zinc-cadmium resistance protein CzcA